MSKIAVNEITDEVGTGAPEFPNGMSVTGAALTDPEVTGGIFLGGTGSANKLDDYEEGTWTPQILSRSSNPNYGEDLVLGQYIKIGNVVTVFGYFRVTGFSDPDDKFLFIVNTPFVSDFGNRFMGGTAIVTAKDGKVELPSDVFATGVAFPETRGINISIDASALEQNNGDVLMTFSSTYYINS